jgi:hypothetical protein
MTKKYLRNLSAFNIVRAPWLQKVLKMHILLIFLMLIHTVRIGRGFGLALQRQWLCSATATAFQCKAEGMVLRHYSAIATMP